MADAAGAPGVTSDEFVASADALRPQLLEEQAETEARGYYSEELHEAFRDAGFYRILVPRRYGGPRVRRADLLPRDRRRSRAAARPPAGCSRSVPATRCRSGRTSRRRHRTSSSRTATSSRPRASGSRRPLAEPIDGGYRVRGTWHFCSGVPYATHHLPLVPTGRDGREHRRRGRRARTSGCSTTGVTSSASREAARTASSSTRRSSRPVTRSPSSEWLSIGVPSTPGFRLHGNPMYGGSFMAFALGELNSVQVGNAQGAVDEYERLLARPTPPGRRGGRDGRAPHDPNYQRCSGSRSPTRTRRIRFSMRCGELYHEYAAGRWRTASRSTRSGRSASTAS